MTPKVSVPPFKTRTFFTRNFPRGLVKVNGNISLLFLRFFFYQTLVLVFPSFFQTSFIHRSFSLVFTLLLKLYI